MNIEKNPKRGRPGRAEQMAIQKKLRPCFERGLTATLTAELTEINIKTVCNYFNKWAVESDAFEKKNFLQRQKEERGRIIRSFDYLIVEEHNVLDMIKIKIEKYNGDEPIPQYLLNKHSDIVKTISNLNEKRGSFAMLPTPDESFDKIIKEKMEVYDKSRQDS
jgi:hypothetical protein